jgi:hypothetical protein
MEPTSTIMIGVSRPNSLETLARHSLMNEE